MAILYKQSHGGLSQYSAHFAHCDKAFIDILSKRVNLNDYIDKLIDKAYNFEAWQGEDIIGLVNAYFNFETETGYITNVSVAVEHHGKGVASNLLDNCIKLALENKLKTISLEVATTNAKAQMLYTKKGFVVESSNENNYIMIKQL
jgi:ribosomal protein S18 acetylase RimI-like enzyme